MKNYRIIAVVLALLLGSKSIAHAQSTCVDLSKAEAIAAWGVHVNKYSQGDRDCMACSQQNPNGMSGAPVSGAPSSTGFCCSYDCSSFATWIVRQIPGQTAFAAAPAGPPSTFAIWGNGGPQNTGSPAGWAPCDPSKQAICLGLTEWGGGGPDHITIALCGKHYNSYCEGCSPDIGDNYEGMNASNPGGTSYGSGATLIEWVTPPGTGSISISSCSSSCTASAVSPTGAAGGAAASPASGDSTAKMMQDMMMMQMMQQMMSSMKSSSSGASSGTSGTSGTGTGSGTGTSGTGTGTSGTGTTGTGTGTGTTGTGTTTGGTTPATGTGTAASGATTTTGTTPSTSTTPATAATPPGQTPLLTSLLNSMVNQLSSLLNGTTASSTTDTATIPQSPAVQELEQLEQQQAEQASEGSSAPADLNSSAVVSQQDAAAPAPAAPTPATDPNPLQDYHPWQNNHAPEHTDYRFYHAYTGSNVPPAAAPSQ